MTTLALPRVLTRRKTRKPIPPQKKIFAFIVLVMACMVMWCLHNLTAGDGPWWIMLAAGAAIVGHAVALGIADENGRLPADYFWRMGAANVCVLTGEVWCLIVNQTG